jgi:hypothetical protein
VVVTVLILFGFRAAIGSNLSLFEQVEPGTTCTATEQLEGEYCLQWVSYPDLLVQKGRQEVHLYVQGHEDGRFYSVPDPFLGDSSGVSIAWVDEGLSISDGTLRLTWSEDALTRLLTD